MDSGASTRRSSALRLRAILSVSILAFAVHGQVAKAQTAPAAPVRSTIDGAGVDLFDGTVNVDAPAATLGGSDNGISYYRWNKGSGWSDNLTAFLKLSGSIMTVAIGTVSDSFTVSGTTYTSTEGNGSTLTYNGTTKIYTYTRSDGTIARFDEVKFNEWNSYGGKGLITDLTTADGDKLTYTYEAVQYCASYKAGGGGYICTRTGYMYRLSAVTNSYGYQIKPTYSAYAYEYDPTAPETQPDFIEFSTPVGATGYNLAVSTTTVQTSQTYGNSTGGGYSYYNVTDALSRQTKYRVATKVLGITRPGSASEDVTYTYSTSSPYRVTGVTTPVGTTTYARSDAGNTRTVTVTDPLSHVSTYLFDIPSRRMTSFTNALSKTTSYQYDSSGRVTRITQPEGNYVQYTYDARGNATETRFVAKTAGTPADIVLTAGYDASCANPVKCNKPNWTKDALANQTDYTYDATHGNVLTVTQPAAIAGGTRPQIRYSYTSLQAYYNKGSGVVASGQAAYRLTGISTCLTSATCSGAAEEAKTVIGYGPQTTGVGNNLLPVSVTQSSGDNAISATTALAYDAIGNLISVDGPLSGTGDTTVYVYDAIRRPLGVMGADPDGAGARKNGASRVTYDTQGRVMLAEQGYTAGQTPTAWTGFTPAASVATTYDAADHKLTETLKNGATAYGLTQYSYDGDGRLSCAAVRMNTAIYGSLPSSACTLGTAGSQGSDRITKYTYDNADRTTLVQRAYGTAQQADEVATTYTNNGQVSYVVDANANRTTYEYDGHDRAVKTRYPVATKGANASSTTDYEQLTYGDNVHVTQRRLRDGSTVGFAFDNLGRVTTASPAGEATASYTYDLLGHVLTAQRSTTLTNAWDALGRLTSEGQPFGSMLYQYDAAGNPIRLTWSDGFYVNYDYDTVGNVTKIRENGATSGVGVLAAYAYDDLGRRTGVTNGNGTSRTYAYDAVSRLAGLKIDPTGTTNDLIIGAVGGTGTAVSYNPASQITGITRSNDAYAWSGHYNFDRNYTANGLNQYTVSGATSLGYDGRGNLISSGSTSYSYSKLNELTSTGGTTLYYDALSRLVEYDTSVSTRFFYSGTNMVAEVANPSGAITHRYVPGPGTDEPIVWYEGSGTSSPRWLQADERGSVVSVTDLSGASIAINRYDEYGIPQSTNLGRFQYTGQVWLGEAGLYYYKARFYSPTLGRFMQTDPIGYGDGMNWYNYVGGDPVNGTDPTGNAQIVNCNWSACSTGHIGGIGTGTGTGSTGSQPPTITSTTSNGDGTGSWTASDGSSGTYDGVANIATINSAYGPVTYSGSTGSFDTIFVTAPTPYDDPWGGQVLPQNGNQEPDCENDPQSCVIEVKGQRNPPPPWEPFPEGPYSACVEAQRLCVQNTRPDRYPSNMDKIRRLGQCRRAYRLCEGQVDRNVRQGLVWYPDGTIVWVHNGEAMIVVRGPYN